MSHKDLSNYYDRRYHGSSDGRVEVTSGRWPRDRFEALVRWAGTGERVLDVGCGDGRVLYNLRGRFRELHGTEVSGERIASARKTLEGLDHHVHDGDVESGIEYEDGLFDSVISADVVEHLVDVRAALREMIRVLHPGGRLVLVTPNIASAKRRIKLLLGSFPATSGPREGLETEPVDGLLDGGHFHYFTFSMLDALLKQAGCTEVEPHGIGKYGRLHDLYPSLLSGACVVVARKPDAGKRG